jgi:hypothetical protein
MLKYSADDIRKYQREQKQLALEAVEKIVVPVANKILDQIRDQIAANPDAEVIYYDIEKDNIYYEEGMGATVELIDMKYEPQLTKALESAGFEVSCTRSKTDGKGKYSVWWYPRPPQTRDLNGWKPSMR